MSKTSENHALSFEFWPIRAEDRNYPFRTENLTFDEMNPSRTLQEYYYQDISMEGTYSTFVFGQKFALTPAIYGILRYKDVTRGELLSELSKITRNSAITGKIEKIITQNNPHIIYLSRIIGIVFDLQRKGIGPLLKDFFEFLKNASSDRP